MVGSGVGRRLKLNMSTAAVTMSAVLSAFDDESWSWTRSLWRFPDQVFSPSLGDLCKSWSCWVGFATEFEVLTSNLKCLGSFSGGRYAGVVWSCVWITAAHKRLSLTGSFSFSISSAHWYAFSFAFANKSNITRIVVFLQKEKYIY